MSNRLEDLHGKQIECDDLDEIERMIMAARNKKELNALRMCSVKAMGQRNSILLLWQQRFRLASTSARLTLLDLEVQK